MPSPFQRLLQATASLDTPFAVIDAPALWANADDLVRRAGGVKIRVASKSVRVRRVIDETLQRPGFAGIMSYSLAESNWLADQGHDDILLAYPTTSRQGLHDLVADERRRAAITVMVDSTESLDHIDSLLGGPGHPPIRVCIDVDSSLKIGPVHLGVRRSPVHTARQAKKLAAAIEQRRGFDLVGLMFYDAQIAGLPDSSRAVRLVKKRSAAELLHRRAKVVAAVSEHARLEIVNAGGTGSLEVTGKDPAITELTAGSGLFSPVLFDGYDAFTSRPAAYFVLSVVRKPAKDIATLFAGGYIASGPTNKNRQPLPVWPTGLTPIGTEGAGEVQSPLKGKAARDLSIGDRVVLRYAKAGEMCERFDRIAIVEADGSTEIVPTYRGERKNFG
ncbi:amino acid deaminase/aldolase [Aeromicrobium wangtongii]|uniref:amino acid deaminase/aldolase n=1 Tax=Aeromicrobium wangtongii TaxID=2969247 RepID=UPI002017CE90|nr:amino acid deaminase/aldolase [Aeromicrobium wangtongii]MCL3817632.1 amino acid deaminase/aldolase [Aeromicrobium wangtongii]